MSLVHLSTWVLLLAVGAESQQPFAIEVVDAETGRGVPLVELRTVNDVCLWTDSGGVAAFFEPGLMGRKVFFHVKSHGYEFPADGFGYRGKALTPTPGGHARLEIGRVNVAQRLYRITGGGIYRDSLLVGRTAPLRQPLLNARVLGSDSVMAAVWQGKIYWFWGDTNRPGYPLGNFKVPGATSALFGHGGLDSEVGVDLDYFVGRDGFAQKTIAAEDPGPTWISGLVVVRTDRMFAHYVNIESGAKNFKTYERGLVEFDDRDRKFHKVATFPLDGPFPAGAHTLLHTDDGTEYVYYSNPYPQIRVPAEPEKLAKLDAYEAFTCLVPGSRMREESRAEREESRVDGRKALTSRPSPLTPALDRRQDGSLRWAWKANTDPVGPEDLAKLVRPGTIGPDQSPWALRDVDSGKPIVAHRGSVAWNAYRKRWVMIACEVFGTSALGETWYAEADRLTGPWLYARKIVTHDNYSFYNPTQHPFFDKDGGRVIFFEGTYTRTFSGNPLPTPRYDYNQMMYKLDLDDARVNLPVPVYDSQLEAAPSAGLSRAKSHLQAEDVTDGRIAFWAYSPDRPPPGTLPVCQVREGQGGGRLEVRPGSDRSQRGADRPLFYVLAADTASPPKATVPLYEFRREADGRRAYATADQGKSLRGYRRSAGPIAMVWPHPF